MVESHSNPMTFTDPGECTETIIKDGYVDYIKTLKTGENPVDLDWFTVQFKEGWKWIRLHGLEGTSGAVPPDNVIEDEFNERHLKGSSVGIDITSKDIITFYKQGARACREAAQDKPQATEE